MEMACQSWELREVFHMISSSEVIFGFSEGTRQLKYFCECTLTIDSSRIFWTPVRPKGSIHFDAKVEFSLSGTLT